MSASGISSSVSSTDVSSASKQLCESSKMAENADGCTGQLALQVVKVPSKQILDLMLDRVDLPRAKYKFYGCENHQVYGTDCFYVSTHRPGDSLQRVIMESAMSTDPEIAEESVALEGIRYMENLENMVVEDLNFSELKYVQSLNKNLQVRLKTAEENILTQRAGLHLALQAMTAISHRLYELTDKYRSAGQSNADREKNAVLELFDKATFDLQHSSGYLTRYL